MSKLRELIKDLVNEIERITDEEFCEYDKDLIKRAEEYLNQSEPINIAAHNIGSPLRSKSIYEEKSNELLLKKNPMSLVSKIRALEYKIKCIKSNNEAVNSNLIAENEDLKNRLTKMAEEISVLQGFSKD